MRSRDENRPVRVGGQAVIEGVMMRAGQRACVAVRRPDGVIETRTTTSRGWASSTESIPLVRGVVALAESLALGVDSLRWSELRSLPPDDERRPAPAWVLVAIALTATLAMIVVIPALVAGAFPAGSAAFEIAETVTRLTVAGGYVALVARRSDVRRVFEYHGAEHLVVAAHEDGRTLTPESVGDGSIRHPRCGTSFLLVISAVAAAVHPFLPVDPISTRLLARLLVVPLVAAVAYEVLTLMGRFATAPARRMGRGTAAVAAAIHDPPPRRAQLEVAIAALEGALDAPNAPTGIGASGGRLLAEAT